MLKKPDPSQTSTSEPRLSERFRDANADITLSSCDGMLFKFYRRNLEVHSGAFSGVEALVATPTEIVNLTETSEVVDILLQLMSPQDHPDLTSLDFRILAPLAEAIEKYQVFSALTACDLSMRTVIPSHSAEVLQYAANHGRVETMNAAAFESIGLRMSEVKEHLSPEVFVTWAQYLELWLDVLGDVHDNDPKSYHLYGRINPTSQQSGIGARIASLKDILITDRLTLNVPSQSLDFNAWRKGVIDKVSKIPKFNTLR